MNGKIYVGQTMLTIKIFLDSDLTDVATALIKYIKPNKTQGQFTAVIENADSGIIKYIVMNPSDLDISGNWKFWAHLTFSDTRVIASTPTTLEILKEGDI